MVLDEPTSSLDLSNAHRTMHMVYESVRKKKICTIMTMHDINLAVHFSDMFVFVKDGRIFKYGSKEIITESLIKQVYDIDVMVIQSHGNPYILPAWNAEDVPNLSPDIVCSIS